MTKTLETKIIKDQLMQTINTIGMDGILSKENAMIVEQARSGPVEMTITRFTGLVSTIVRTQLVCSNLKKSDVIILDSF